MNMNMNMNKNLLICSLVIIGIVLVGYVALSFYTPEVSENIPEGTACTLDAMICPDGSAVGRIPPLCEFAACPISNDKEFEKLLYDKNQDIGFEYNQLETSYVKAQSWPPKISLSKSAYSCADTSSTKVAFNGKEYCLQIQSEGAAGTTYKNYSYRFKEGDNLITLKSTFRFPQCLNYNDPEKTECQNDQATFTDKTILEHISPIKVAASRGVQGMGNKFEVIKGTFDCIINDEIDGTKNTTCRRSITTADGTLYALDIQDTAIQRELEVNARGKQIVASGVYTPIEALSSNFWRQYGVKGILTLSQYQIL